MGKPVVIGVDVGGTNVKVAVVDAQGQLLREGSWPTESELGPEAFATRLLSFAEQLTTEAQVAWSDVQSVGVGIPGFLDIPGGFLEEAPNMHWHNVPIVDLLQGALHKPVFIDNDANLAALGEVWLGAGKNASCAVCITLGTGVGAGVILSGEVYRGASAMAGEVGHMPIKPDGELCNCGHIGCLETMASASALERHGKQAGLVSPRGEGEVLTAKDIFALAEAGNATAQAVIDELVRWLGVGLACIANTLNPDVMVIGGGLVQAGDALMQPLASALRQYALDRVARACQIVPATLGAKAGVLGAARLGWQGVAKQ